MLTNTPEFEEVVSKASEAFDSWDGMPRRSSDTDMKTAILDRIRDKIVSARLHGASYSSISKRLKGVTSMSISPVFIKAYLDKLNQQAVIPITNTPEPGPGDVPGPGNHQLGSPVPIPAPVTSTGVAATPVPTPPATRQVPANPGTASPAAQAGQPMRPRVQGADAAF